MNDWTCTSNPFYFNKVVFNEESLIILHLSLFHSITDFFSSPFWGNYYYKASLRLFNSCLLLLANKYVINIAPRKSMYKTYFTAMSLLINNNIAMLDSIIIKAIWKFHFTILYIDNMHMQAIVYIYELILMSDLKSLSLHIFVNRWIFWLTHTLDILYYILF